jgi:hypothetical protein
MLFPSADKTTKANLFYTMKKNLVANDLVRLLMVTPLWTSLDLCTYKVLVLSLVPETKDFQRKCDFDDQMFSWKHRPMTTKMAQTVTLQFFSAKISPKSLGDFFLKKFAQC